MQVRKEEGNHRRRIEIAPISVISVRSVDHDVAASSVNRLGKGILILRTQNYPIRIGRPNLNRYL